MTGRKLDRRTGRLLFTIVRDIETLGAASTRSDYRDEFRVRSLSTITRWCDELRRAGYITLRGRTISLSRRALKTLVRDSYGARILERAAESTQPNDEVARDRLSALCRAIRSPFEDFSSALDRLTALGYFARAGHSLRLHRRKYNEEREYISALADAQITLGPSDAD